MWSSVKDISQKITTKEGFFVAGAVLLLLLLLRSPFGERTLIPNLEPYPDTLHYIVPARSFITKGLFKLTREYGEINPSVAPFYSILLMPFYLLNIDVRMFYLLNVTLSFITFYLLFKVLDFLLENKWTVGLTLFVYITNYYIYWYPQWAMAENLTLTLFVGSLYLITKRVSFKNIIFACLVAVGFYAAKYAYPLLTFSYFFIYLLKIIKSEKDIRGKGKTSMIIKYLAFFAIFQLLVFTYQYCQSGSSPLHSLIHISKSVSGLSTSDSNLWFSSQYFSQNIRKYLNAIFGGSQKFLWNYNPLYPKWMFCLSSIGILVNFFNKKKNFVVLTMVIMILATVSLLSFFYASDVRYIYHIIPVMVVGLGLFLSSIDNFLRNKKKSLVFWVIFSAIGLYYFSSSIYRIKDQIVLNLKYAEVPWYYKSVLVLNDYFDGNKNSGMDTYVISPMAPYYVDFYSNGNYKLLPLSSQQDFREDRQKTWGPGNYENLSALYKDKLNAGSEVYVFTYGLGNEGYLHTAFDDIESVFNLTEVANDCYSQCILYRLDSEKYL